MITNFKNSDEYRKKIHNLIPGGAHTYSKGDDQFPLLSPAAISYGKGGYLFDIDDNKFLDCSMGLTSVSLGHAYEPVINRIKLELDKGVNFMRPSIIEGEMAEKFLSLVQQHDMIKFAKNGSIVTTAAVKLARAKTGRKLVAFPSDHPFYSYDDWFIAKTACNLGIPDEIIDLSVTFKSNDLKSLEELFSKYPNQIACVITEPERSVDIEIDCAKFIKEAIELTHKNGALFILDEMITGFKTDFPGSIKKFNIKPDMATWGKGIANGFSFCALTGTKDVMELGGIRNTGSEKVFLVSTTHGGETHTIAAGLATIHEFEKNKVIEKNQALGDYFVAEVNKVILAKRLQAFVSVYNSNWMPILSFKNKNGDVCNGMRTYVLQELIKKGVLCQGIFIPCFNHTKFDVDYFCDSLDFALNNYEQISEMGFENVLIGSPTKPVFRKFL
jgi:glutamate-1-semialdehyde aminotransferase